MNKPLNIQIKATDYHWNDGQLKLKGVTTQNWISHFDFFVPQRVSNGDTDTCWAFGATKNVDAFMDALIEDGIIPTEVVNQLTIMGFMDVGTDGKSHFHSSERFAAVLSGIGENGGMPAIAWDLFRKNGVVPFTRLPIMGTMTTAEYFDPTAITPELKQIGLDFLNLMGGADFLQYQWVVNGTTDVNHMAAVISNGPLALGIPVNSGWNQLHPIVATGTPVHVVSAYQITPPSVSISDNYSPFLKVLDEGYEIPYAQQVILQYIAPLPVAPSIPLTTQSPASVSAWSNWLSAVASWLQNLLKGRN